MYRKLISKLSESELEGYIVYKDANKRYICSLGQAPGYVFLSRNKAFMITNSRNIDYYKEIYPKFEVLKGGIQSLKRIIDRESIKTIGYESNHITVDHLKNLQQSIRGCAFVARPDFVEDMRMIKTPAEIELLEQAAAIGDKAFDQIIKFIKVGMTEKEIQIQLDQYLLKNGGDDFSFTSLVSSGMRCFIPHSASTEKRVEEGDFVLMDFGVSYKGYCSDMTRTVVMGKASERQRQLYALVLKAQAHAIENIRSGITAHEADALARTIIMAHEPEGCYDYGLGHGVGLEVHEKFRLGPNETNILKENQAVTVEPGVYIKGWGGIRIEDTIIVGKDRNKVLNKSPKELMII